MPGHGLTLLKRALVQRDHFDRPGEPVLVVVRAPEEQERTLDLATDQAWDAPALYRRWLSVQA